MCAGLALLFSCGLAGAAPAEGRDVEARNLDSRVLHARVIWTRADYIYVASPDSGVLAAGMAVSVRRGTRELCRGRIERLYEPHLAAARVTSGSLADADHLEDLLVEREPAIDPGPTSVRVGLPARERRNLLFACDAPSVGSTFAGEHFRIDPLPGGALRMRRLIESPRLPIAPDTIDVLFFAEATDAEIALERGDLDVAVFWPGELSARMRDGEHVLAGRRSHGVLACVRTTPDSLPVPPGDLAQFNRDGFAGDLEPWPSSATPDSPASAAARYRVDPSLPGARVLERVLARVSRAAATRTVWLRYIPEGTVMGTMVTASGTPGEPGASAVPAWLGRDTQPAFAMRCLVVTRAHARALVSTLGPGAFADMIVCGGAVR